MPKKSSAKKRFKRPDKSKPRRRSASADTRLRFAKGEQRTRIKARKARQRQAHVQRIRRLVFLRDGSTCRCCGWRQADSMHELRFKSLGGVVSLDNSVAVDGSGTTGCHGFLQRNEIHYEGSAQERLTFVPRTEPAALQVGVLVGQPRYSSPCQPVNDRAPRGSQPQ